MSDERMRARDASTAPEAPRTEAPEGPRTEAPAAPRTEAPAAPRTEAPAAPRTEAPSEDVARSPQAAFLPGEHRGGFQRALTQPTTISQPVHTEVAWAPAPEVLPRSGVWALGLAIVGLTLSLIVGWAFPLGIAAVALAIAALRRPWENRGVAVWALVLGAVSLVYSAGWLTWAAFQAGLIG